MSKIIANLTHSWTNKGGAGSILGILLVLLNMAYFPRTTFPADEAKWQLLQVFAPGLALFYMVAALFNQEKINVRISSFQVGVLLLFTWAATSGSWVLNLVSFPASLLDMSSLVIVLVFFSFSLQDTDHQLPVFFLGFFSTMVAAVGVLQYFGLDGGLYHQYVKPASFFVNKNYASPIVAASLPLLGLTLLSGPQLRKRLPLLAIFHLNFAYLLISGTKSSWLAYFGSMTAFTCIAFNVEAYRKHFAKDFLLKNLGLIASGIVLSLVLAYIHDHGTFPVMFRNLLPQTGIVLLLAGFTAISPLLSAGLINLWRRGFIRHHRLPHLVLLVLVSGMIFYFISRPTPVLERINTTLTAESTLDPMFTSWSARIPLWLNSLAIIRDHPMLGVGLGSFEAAYPLYHKALVNDLGYTTRLWIGGAHNDPLQLLAELGLVGFAIAFFCFFMISRYFHILMKAATPSRALLLTGCYLGGLALVLESLFNPVFHQPSCLMLLALFTGIIHSSLYTGTNHPEQFIFRREIAPGKRFLYLTPLAVLFFLILSVSAPWAIRRYQAFVHHKEAVAYFKVKMADDCYAKLQEAVNKWPYSSTILSETNAASYLYLQRHFNAANLQQAIEYNQRALRAQPYHYNTNRIRISLLRYLPGGISEISNYAPLLLKVAPDDKLEEARRETNF